MFYIREKQLMVTKSAWCEMDYLGLPIQRIISIIEEGSGNLRAQKLGNGWRRAGLPGNSSSSDTSSYRIS
jgi:hypothetical protein